MNNWKSF